MGRDKSLMLRRSLHCFITGLGQFRLDLFDPRPDLGKGHVARRLDLGAIHQQPMELGNTHGTLLSRGSLLVLNRQVSIRTHLLGLRTDRNLYGTSPIISNGNS